MNQIENKYEAQRLVRLAEENITEAREMRPGDNRRGTLIEVAEHFERQAQVHATLATIADPAPIPDDVATPIGTAKKTKRGNL
jgi:hypothetical protein